MQATHISLAHGNGGRFMRELIEDLVVRCLGSPRLDTDSDAVRLPDAEGPLLITTDGFTVQPLEFPGGDIGALAIHGTVNDLAVAGALPRWLTLNLFIEEGLETAVLERLLTSAGRAAAESGVQMVAGDTKVLRRGEGGGLYLATTGVGTALPGPALDIRSVRAGDRLLVSGPVGDHGIAVMLAREAFGLRGDLASDATSVLPLTRAIRAETGLRFMRDPTRGGLATVCHEISRATGLRVRLEETAIPVRDPVRSVCEMLGYDPLYLACEGRVVAAVASEDAERVLSLWQALPQGAEAAIVGELVEDRPGVELRTSLGGRRMLEELEDDPLPRIC